jgi:kynurenine formamidase
MKMPRRAMLFSAIGGLIAGCRVRESEQTAQALPERIVDLTHPLSPESPYIRVENATFPFQRDPIATIPHRGVYANRWALTEHIGTHLDAPCHFAEHGACVHSIPVHDLLANAVVIDVSQRAAADPDVELTEADLDRCIADHGPFPARCAILLRSGWDTRWPSQASFANADTEGTMHFPGFSLRAIERLARLPDVLGIGTDTFSIDPGRDETYAGHKVLAAAGKWALECVAHLGQLPLRGARIFVGAIPVESASGSPARVVAWSPI